jgi:hypothetical protein
MPYFHIRGLFIIVSLCQYPIGGEYTGSDQDNQKRGDPRLSSLLIDLIQNNEVVMVFVGC